MRALIQNQDGDESSYSLGEVPKPKIFQNEALIKVIAAALNPVDLVRGQGFFGPDKFPRICGYDFAGIIEEINCDSASDDQEKNRLKKGDKVFGDVMKNSMAKKEGRLGTVAEWLVCPVDMLAKVERNDVKLYETAGLGCVCLTAIQCFKRTSLKKGERLIVMGGTTAVGLHAMMIARNSVGVDAIACTASESSFEMCKKVGNPDKLVDYRKNDIVLQLEGWGDVVIDCVGDFDRGKKLLKSGGRLVSIVAESFERDDIDSLYLAPEKKDVQVMEKLFNEKKITPIIDSTFDFVDAIKAIQKVGSGRAKGKVIIKIADA